MRRWNKIKWQNVEERNKIEIKWNKIIIKVITKS